MPSYPFGAGRRRLRFVWLLLFCLAVAGASTYALDLAKRCRPGPELPDVPLREKMSRTVSRDERLEAGSEAPDFTLSDAAGHRVRLSSFRGKRPVVLVLGSFGCNLFCNELASVRRLRDAYGGRAEFLFVYIREAHHEDATPLPKASTPLPPAGNDFDHRAARVRWYEAESGTGLTWLIDEGGAAEDAYDGWPRRLVVVGADGRVVVDAGHGLPLSWDLSAVEKGLRQALAVPAAPLTPAASSQNL
jgi:hypothetical protein